MSRQQSRKVSRNTTSPQLLLHPGTARDVEALPYSCWAKRKLNSLTNAVLSLEKIFTKTVVKKLVLSRILSPNTKLRNVTLLSIVLKGQA